MPNLGDVELQIFPYYRRKTAYYMHISRVFLHEYSMKIRFSSANMEHWLRKKSSKVLNLRPEGLKPSTRGFKTFDRNL